MNLVKNVFFVIMGILSIFIIISPNTELINKFLYDDTFYYFQIVKNTIEHGCICFNNNVPTNGFHPLYFLILLPFQLLKLNLIKSSLLLLLGIHIITTLLGSSVLEKLKPKTGKFFILMYGLNPKIVFNTLLGVETPFKVLFISLLLMTFLKKNNSQSQRWILLGLCASRLDGIFFVFVLFFMDLLFGKFNYKKYIPVTVFYTLFMLIGFLFVGSALPISGKAVPLALSSFFNNRTFLDGVLNAGKTITTKIIFVLGIGNIGTYIIAFTLFVILFYTLFKNRHELYENKKLHFWLTLGIFFEIFYYTILQRIYKEWYFLVPYFFITFYLSFSANILFTKNKKKGTFVVLVIILLFISSARILWKESNHPRCLAFAKMGGLIESKNYTGVASFNTGALQYFSPSIDILNLDGVVNPNAYNALKSKNFTTLLEKNNITYYADRGDDGLKRYIEILGYDYDENNVVAYVNVPKWSHTQKNYNITVKLYNLSSSKRI